LPSCDDVTDLEAVLAGRATRCSTREFLDEMYETRPDRTLGEETAFLRNAVQVTKMRWKSLHCGLGLLLLAIIVVWCFRPKVQDDNHGNVAQHVDFFLPNRGHKDADGEWRADTWDHFKIPQCDSGPPKGSMELVHWLQNVKTWVNDTKGTWVDGMWYTDPSKPDGGRWVDGHMEYKGHFEWLPKNMSKWVPKKKTAKQLDCVRRQNDANGYHQKLIQQHETFLKLRSEDEDLLRWQGEHQCHEQLVDVAFAQVPNEKLETSGAASGALCQKMSSLKGYDGFTWSAAGGCVLKSLGQRPSFEAIEKPQSFSGYACSKQATYISWITDEAQKHTLYDGMSVTEAPNLAAMPQSTLCFTLVKPYSTDLKLVEDQARGKFGIFSCDHSVVYSSQLLEFPFGIKTRKIYSSQMVEKGGQWNVELNTDVSMAVLREVLKDPEWREVKWIIQADPQCVFFPARLHKVLEVEQVWMPTFLVQSESVGFPSFFQVMTQSALKELAQKSRECFWQMRYWGDSQYHGPMWIDTCMRKIVHARRSQLAQLANSKGCDQSNSYIASWPISSPEAQRQCYAPDSQ